jgi:hypothetical protein
VRRAEHIGDFSTNKEGNGHNTFKLIVQEAFSSTLVNGARVRVDFHRVSVWFADPVDDDFCLGPQQPRDAVRHPPFALDDPLARSEGIG